MLFKHSMSNLILIIVMLLCYAAVGSYGSVVNADSWQNFGNQTLYFLASDRCPMPTWLKHEQQFIDAFSKPDSPGSILVVESFVERALRGYERDYFVWQGRIPLDINPRCILGLFLANKLPNTKLAIVGWKHFEQSIERSCLVALEKGTTWQSVLEAELTKAARDPTTDFKPEFFDEREISFLLIYLIENGGSETVRQQARQKLADHLLERFGLEPALRQYRILLEGPNRILDDLTQLNVVQQLEETGAILDAQQLYERILQNTNSPEVAMDASERLARIRLANQDLIHAWTFLDVFYKRFSNIQPKSKDLESFFLNFEVKCQERLNQLRGELLSAQEPEKALNLCQLCEGLWTEQEAISQWRHMIESAKPESPAMQIAHLYLAQNLVKRGKIDEANEILNNLSTSTHPAIRARILMVSADIAQRMDRIHDAVDRYQQAAQIKRHTILPKWLETFQIKQLELKKMSTEELRFFVSFLHGYNELIDGDFDAGATNLLKAKEIINKVSERSPIDEVKMMIPSLLMLAYLNTGDYARAEQHGLQAMKNLAECEQNSKQISKVLSQSEQIDSFLFASCRELRALPKSGSRSRLTRFISKVYTAQTALISLKTNVEPARAGLVQLFSQTKMQRVKRLLFGEYNLARTQLARSDNLEKYPILEPVIFTVQLLGEDSFELISQALATVTPPECAQGQMYRFAKFAQGIKQPYLTRMALTVATQQIETVPGNVQLLNDIADMYLKGKNHQRAIEIYERIAEQASDHYEAEKAQLDIIKVYAEQMKLYDRAIQECQKFLKKFSDSAQVSQVEFLLGKLAYLNRDYIGATGQLDSFQRKYPDSPQVCQAMMLAALGRMSEGNTMDAIDRFVEIIQKYPDSNLAARSKFLIGYVQVSEQKYSHALETFKQLIEQFPKSEYVGQAKSIIERLSKVSSQ